MLEVADLHAHYGRAHILQGISFSIATGEVLVLLGHNGAGKSTTLKSLVGLVRPSGGRVVFQGRDVAGWETHRIVQAGLGYVPEERRIFADLTVMENLEVGRREVPGGWTVERLLALFPNLAAMRERLGGRMSGGEQQMLTIARTLMGNPRLVLLDEPSEGLAPVIVEQMAAAILEMKTAGVTVLLAEQNLHFAARVADRAAVIERGRIVWAGEMRKLAEDRDLRSALLSV